MTLFDRIADLPLVVEDYDLELREADTSSDFTRTTTVVALRGEGETGRGEDVTYENEDHYAFVAEGTDLPLAGEYSFAEFSETVGALDLFPGSEPERDAFRNYRRWAVESAALDLALKQAGTSLARALDREYDPVRFVASTRLGDPPTFDRIEALLDRRPDLEFKLDPTSDWTVDLVDRLVETGAVRVLDLKGQYQGTTVDQPADVDLYELVVERFPDAIVEDPAATEETRPILEPHAERIAWDYPITGVESVEDREFESGWINVKPSRFGSVRSLLDAIEYCLDQGVRMYGGGQFELDVGREHLHTLASLFYPDAPNDVAPRAYNEPTPPDILPTSPLAPPREPSGFEW